MTNVKHSLQIWLLVVALARLLVAGWLVQQHLWVLLLVVALVVGWLDLLVV